MLNHIYCFISCNDFKDILDSLLERGLKQLSPGVFGLFRSSIHQMLHVITLSTKQTIFAPLLITWYYTVYYCTDLAKSDTGTGTIPW